jgi:hypothetical protein
MRIVGKEKTVTGVRFPQAGVMTVELAVTSAIRNDYPENLNKFISYQPVRITDDFSNSKTK